MAGCDWVIEPFTQIAEYMSHNGLAYCYLSKQQPASIFHHISLCCIICPFASPNTCKKFNHFNYRRFLLKFLAFFYKVIHCLIGYVKSLVHYWYWHEILVDFSDHLWPATEIFLQQENLYQSVPYGNGLSSDISIYQ